MRTGCGRARSGTGASPARCFPGGCRSASCAMPMPARSTTSRCSPTSSEHKAHGRRIQFLAQYDPLTRLPNRVLLLFGGFEHALAAAGRRRCALLFLDLDRFKNVNDCSATASVTGCLKPSRSLCARRCATATPLPARRRRVRRAARRPAGRRRRTRGGARRRQAAGRARATLPDRHARAAHHQQRRHQPVSGPRCRCRDADPQRRHGDVPRQTVRAGTTSSSSPRT